MRKVIRVLINGFRYIGVRGILSGIYRHILHPVSPNFKRIEPHCRGKQGLEVGGPTRYFSRGHYLPIYTVAAGLDNCNFSSETIWEGKIEEQGSIYFDGSRRLGTQYVREAGDLKSISDDKYDFLVSSHVLEHTANPIMVMNQWMRVLKPGGYLVLIVPHRDMTFDRVRPITPLPHLIADFDAGMGEDDLTHIDDYVKYNVANMDKDAESNISRLKDNYKLRTMHHHVFDTQLVVELLNFTEFEIDVVSSLKPNSILCSGVKSEKSKVINNTAYLQENAAFRSESPYPSDRIVRIDSQSLAV